MHAGIGMVPYSGTLIGGTLEDLMKLSKIHGNCVLIQFVPPKCKHNLLYMDENTVH